LKWVFLTYIILNPLFFWVGVENRDAQQLFYQLSSVILFSIGMFFNQREVKQNPINICLGVMLIAFIGAWLRTTYGWEFALNYLLGLLVYFTFLRTIKKDDIPFLINGVAWLLILAVVWQVSQMLGFDPRGTIIRNTTGRVGRNAFFFHASSMGIYFAQGVPLLLGVTPFGLILLPIMKFTECSSAYLGLGVSIMFFYWFRKRILFWILLPIILISGVYLTYNREAFTGIKMRLPLWGFMTQEIMKHPMGHGLDSFNNPVIGQNKYYVNAGNDELIVLRKKNEKEFDLVKGFTQKPEQLHEYDNPHNEYLWLGYEVGLHALIILGFLFYFIWDRFRKCRKRPLEVAFMASLIAFCLCSIGQFPIHLARVGYMLPIILGGFVIMTEED